MLQACVVIGVLVGFALLVGWAKSQGRDVQKAIDEAIAARETLKTVEKSHEVSEAADARRDPGLHDVPDVVPVESVPSWLKPRGRSS